LLKPEMYRVCNLWVICKVKNDEVEGGVASTFNGAF